MLVGAGARGGFPRSRCYLEGSDPRGSVAVVVVVVVAVVVVTVAVVVLLALVQVGWGSRAK